MNCIISFAKKFALPVFIIFALSLTACQVGLGAAVDSQPPVVDIQLPAANSIIRDKFTMSGNWSDDREIAGIKVELENSGTKETLLSVDVPAAQLSDNKWFLEINPLMEGVKLPDGKYNATVTITDKVNHATSSSVAFTIDNTPPLVILSRPSTKEGSLQIDEYGCNFSIEGEAVDDNLISLVEVEVYDSETNELKTTVALSNVSKKIDRSVAVFGADDKVYEKIFGVVEKLEDVRPKNFYCKVFAYDEARQVPAVADDKGNKTEIFYIEEDIDKYRKEYKSSGLYEILKGTYSSSAERVADPEYTIEEVEDVFNSKKSQKAIFTLDPRNNPKYTVSGHSNLFELGNDLKEEKLDNNSTVTIEFQPGLDGYYLDRDTIGVSVIECDEHGTVLEDAEPIVLFAPYKDKNGNILVELSDDEIRTREASFKVSKSTYSLTIPVGTKSDTFPVSLKETNPSYRIAHYYKFIITGYDEKKIGIFNYAGTDYGFKLVLKNAIPEINISKLERKSASGSKDGQSSSQTDLCEGEKLIIHGSVTLQDMDPLLDFTIGLATDLSGEGTKLNKNGKILASDFAKNGFECDIDDSYKNKKFVIRVIATNPEEEDQTSSERISVSYDCKGPEFKNTEVNPKIDGKVNGKVIIKATVSDTMNVVETVEYSVTNDGKESARKTVEDLSGSGFELDTTVFDDENGKGNIIVNIYATDAAGNTSKNEVPLIIDQSTDAPVITFTTVDAEISDLDGIRKASEESRTANIFQINGTNNYIGGSITDDDGIDSVIIYKKAKDSGEWKPEVLLENGKTTAFNLKNVAAKVQGEYDVYIEVKDTAGEATGFNMTTSKTFHIGVDEGAPNFVITSTQGLQAQNADLKVTGTVSDGTDVEIRRFAYKKAEAFEKGKRYFKKSTDAYIEQDSSEWTSLPAGEYFYRVQDSYFTTPIKINVGTTLWEDIIPAAEVGIEGDILYYEATDDFGQTTGQAYLYSIDNQSPLFTIKKAKTEFSSALSGKISASSRENVFVKVTASDPYLSIEGTAEDIDENDPTKSRGLDEFAYYTIIDAEEALSEDSLVNGAFDISGWKQTKKIENHTWKQTVDLNEYKLGDGKKYILYVAVKDAAGNISKVSENPCSAVYIIPDQTAPVISNPSYMLGETEIADAAIQINTSNKEKEIVLKVKISDDSTGTPSGVTSVEILENNVPYAYEKSITHTGADYTIKIKAADLLTGTHVLTVRATDKVGNYKDFTCKEISVDITNPEIPMITGITPYVTDESENQVYNGIINVKINASDETALDKIIWWVADVSGTKVISNTEIECSGTTSKSATVQIDTDVKLSNTSGDFEFIAKAVDKGGNESGTVSQILKIDQKTDQPKIVLTNAEVGITNLDAMKEAVLAGTTDNIFGSTTNNKLNFTVSDDDGIASVKVNDSVVYEYESGSYQKTLKLVYTLPSEKNLHDIKIDVTDCKNETTSFNSNTTGTFKVAVDDTKPEISNFKTTIDAKSKGNVLYTNNSFDITFDVKDDYKLDSLVYVENDETSNSVEVTADSTKQAKTISIAKRGSAGDITKVRNVITLKDAFGRFAEKELTYVFDLKAPEFSDVKYSLINDGFMDASKTFTVTGSVSDAGTDQSGIDTVKFAVAKGFANVYPSDADKVFKDWTDVSGAASSWTAKLDAGEITEEGNYTLFVKAADLAGNETTYTAIKFTADIKAPVCTIEDPELYYGKSAKDTGVVISGTLTETYFSSWKVLVNEIDVTDDDGYKKTAPESGTGKVWSVTLPVADDGSKDGKYAVQVTFTDSARKSVSTKAVQTTIDTTAPESLEVTSPAEDAKTGKNAISVPTFKFEGTAQDNAEGTGVKTVYYLINANATATAETGSWAAVNGTTGWNQYGTFKTKGADGEGFEEGTYYLHVYAEDNAGNKSAVVSRKFDVDMSAPVLTVGSYASQTNESFALSGKAFDTRGLKVETAGVNIGKPVVKVVQTNPAGKTKELQFAVDSQNKWTSGSTLPAKTGDETKLADGTYKYTISVTDEVGKVTTDSSVSVLYDVTPPAFAETGIYSNTFETWTNTNKITVTPGITDTNLESKSYVVLSEEKNPSEITEGEWNNISGTSKTVSFDEGQYYLYLRAVDKVGNTSYKSGYSIWVDTVAQDISIEKPEATLLVNGESNIEFKGTVSEAGTSGIQKIEIRKGGYNGTLIASTVEADQSDSVAALVYNSETGIITGNILASTIDTTGSSFGIYALVTDNAGNIGKNVVNIGVDKTAPVVAWTAPANDDTVYRIVTFTGRSSDMNTITSTKLKYYAGKTGAGADAVEVWKEVTDLNSGSTANSWSFDLDTFNASARNKAEKENKYTVEDIYDTDPTKAGIQGRFKVVSVDVAGNEGESEEIVLTVNQDADRPVIKFEELDGVNNLIMNTSEVKFTVTDNDAVDSVTVTNGSVVFEAGSYRFTPTSAEEAADIELSFTIKDKAGRTYTTGASNDYDRPYVQYKDSSQFVDNNSAVVYKYDMTKPVIEKIEIGTGASEDDAKTMAKGNSPVELSSTETVVGGTEKKFVVFKVTAKDLNKVNSVKGTITKSANDKISLSFTRDEETATAERQVFYSAPVDLAGFATSTLSVDFIATDNSNLESVTVQCSSTGNIIYVDNAGPVLTLTEPLSATEYASSPLELKGTYSDVKSSLKTIRALVLDDKYFSAENVINEETVKEVLAEGEISAVMKETENVSFNFSTSVLPQPETLTTKYTMVSHDAQNIYTVPVVFYMEDSLGNVSYETKEFLFNPYGNRPKSAVTYPAGTTTQRASLNGAIRITGSSAQGSATGAAPSKVYLQFDMDNDGDFDADDKTILEGLSAYGYAIKTSEKLTGSIDYSAIGSASDFWGVEANGTTSWYYTVNQSLELQNNSTKDSENESKYNFGVRVVALAGTTFGSWSDGQFVEIDTNLPVINKDIPYITPSNESDTKRVYQQDMYLKGTQYLHMTVSDAEKTVAAGGNGIKKVMIYRAKTKEGLLSSASFANGGTDIKTVEFKGDTGESGTGNGTIYWKVKNWGTEAYGYEIDIPLTDLNSDSMYVKVVAYKANDNNTYEVYNMNFDNTAPKIDFTTLNSVKTKDSDMKMLNSNGRFTVGGEVEDTGAGFDKAAFYYYRGAVDDESTLKYNRRVYDPMPNVSGATNNDREVLVQNKEANALATGITAQKADGSLVTDSREICEKSQVMFGATKTVSVSSNGLTVTLSDDDDKHIRAGGLVYIGGTYLVIDSKTGSSITLVSPSAVTGDNVSAFFPYMQVVNNTGAEKTDETGLVVSSGDDGDAMPESIVKSSTKWTWDATFNSLNIPDGPGYLVVFVWDKAGNVSSQTYPVSVQNHAPRLTKLSLGTKLSGTTWKDSDFQTYEVLSKVGEQNSYNMNTADYLGKQFRIRGDFAVVTEFVGGNLPVEGDTIKAVFNKASPVKEKVHQKGEGFELVNPKTSAEIGSILTDGIIKSSFKAAANNTYMYVIGSSVINDASHTLESTYDAETDKWTSKPMSFTFWDKTSDTVQGTDSCYMFLRLNDLAVNFVDNASPVVKIDPFYWNSREDSSVPLDSDGLPLGHIDLGATPKVSGQVYIRGTVTDDTMVKELYMITPGTDEVFKVAEYGDDGWSSAIPLDQNHVEYVEVKDIQAPDAQSGHTVEFCFKVNMTKYGVDTGKELRVYAKDSSESGNTSTTDETIQTTSTAKTSLYTMDFVPYIKGVRGANRSRLGRYPVQAGQEIVIEGMNFAEGAKYKVNFYKSAEASKATRTETATTGLIVNSGDNDSWAGTISTAGEITIKAPKFSTYFEVAVTKAGSTTDYVETSNNNNSNTGANIEMGGINSVTKAPVYVDGENIWTDDRYLSVWNVGTYLPNSNNPMDGTIEKFEKDAWFCMSDTQRGNSIAKNNIVGVWGTDAEMLYTAELGGSLRKSLNGDASGNFNAPPVSTDMCIVDIGEKTELKNFPFYVFLDNTNLNGNTWGIGLTVVRERQQIQKSWNTTAAGYTIESQSGNKMMFQFQNPKITGVYDSTGKYNGNNSDGMYYMYVSYYDAFAHCLKYASFDYTGMYDGSKDFTYKAHFNAGESKTAGTGLVAGNDTDSVLTEFTEECGQWSDIKVDSVDGKTKEKIRPVIVYYNKSNKCLNIARGNSASPTKKSEWTITENIKPNNSGDFGRYVSMEIDNAGGLHITAQDVDNGVLYYGYAPRSESKYNVTWVKVDATSTVGRWTDIKLETPNGTTTVTNNVISSFGANPVLTYMDSSKLNTKNAVKIAYVVENKWECVSDPAEFEADDEKLSLVLSCRESIVNSAVTSKVGVGFNSSMFAVDFLRDEQ